MRRCANVSSTHGDGPSPHPIAPAEIGAEARLSLLRRKEIPVRDRISKWGHYPVVDASDIPQRPYLALVLLVFATACGANEADNSNSTEPNGDDPNPTAQTCSVDGQGWPIINDRCPALLVTESQRFVGTVGAQPLGGGLARLSLTEVNPVSQDSLELVVPALEPGTYARSDCMFHELLPGDENFSYGGVSAVSRAFELTITSVTNGVLRGEINGQLCRIDDVISLPVPPYTDVIKGCREFFDARISARIEAETYRSPDPCEPVEADNDRCVVPTASCDIVCPPTSALCEAVRPKLVGTFRGSWPSSERDEDPRSIEITYDDEGHLRQIQLRVPYSNPVRPVPPGVYSYSASLQRADYIVFGNSDSLSMLLVSPDDSSGPTLELWLGISRIEGADGSVQAQLGGHWSSEARGLYEEIGRVPLQRGD